jgi:hypothetical protein
MSREPRRVFSARLDNFLEALREGGTPNHGRFCSFCYNPLPAEFDRCDHCGQDQKERAPLVAVPEAVIEMHKRMQKRESLIVNAFAYFGLALALTLFLGLVAINVLYIDNVLWFFIATGVLLIGARVPVIGGVIGVNCRYANRRLAEDWAGHGNAAERPRRRTHQRPQARTRVLFPPHSQSP